MKNPIITALILVAAYGITFITGCVDDSRVSYNEYDISNISTPVDKNTSDEKKVYIGHDLPVNVTITATYDETDVPIQVYLLNADDIEEVEDGIGFISDIRMYYCHRTPFTMIDQLLKGTNTYGIVINIPAEESKDELTEDLKTGTFYVVAEVNKNEDAEIDAFAVYEKFKDKLTDYLYKDANQIVVASEYTSKPDLSVEKMMFTGGSDNPEDVLVWYNVDLNNLPGISQSSLEESKRIIIIEPSEKDRNFTGTIHVKSSASDALNVPLEFRIEKEDATGDTSISVPLEIYDKSIGGWVEQYYIPILKANTIERITLGLRIPEDYDYSGTYNYFSNYDEWPPGNIDNYPLSEIRHSMGKADYGEHNYKIVSTVNPGGTITESRFINPNETNIEYSTADYHEDGGSAAGIIDDNNIKSEDITFVLEKVEVSPNEGIKTYPYYKMDPKDPDYRSIVIFWDGFEFNVGDDAFGANAEAHEGMFFYNYSLYSLGMHVWGSIFNNAIYLINTHLNAESHPYNKNDSGFEFHIEGGSKTVLSEASEGFSDNTWEYPILLWGKEFEKEKWCYCFKFAIKAGIEIVFTPGARIGIFEDGSLTIDKFASLRGSVYADASASIAGLATVGLYTYIDVLTLSFIQSCYTTTEYDNVNYPGRVKGTLNREVGLYLIGPKGYLDLYFEINFIFFSKRWDTNIFSFQSFTLPLLEMDFLTFADNDYENLTSTNWIRVEDTNLLPLDTSNSE